MATEIIFEPLTAERVAELRAVADWMRIRIATNGERLGAGRLAGFQARNSFWLQANPGAVVELCEAWERKHGRTQDL